MALPDPARRTGRSRSSAIREILVQARGDGVVSLAGGVPASSTFPLDIIRDATDRALSGTGSLQYGVTVGEEEARSVFARWTGADRLPDPDAVVVTTGSQQGIDLLARCYLDPGDAVVVGSVEYLGAIQAFRASGARLHPVPVDAAGLDVDALARDLRAGARPRLVYVVPNHHNPTGATLDAARADHLVDLAERYGFLVVEDDPYRELTDPGCEPVALSDSPHVVRLRSTSKMLAPGLRCAWLVADPAVVEVVTVAKQAVDLHTSTLSQAVAAQALADPRLPGHLRRLAAVYRNRRTALHRALADIAPDLDVSAPTGGMFLWVGGWGPDTAAVLPRAVAAGVAFVPGAVFGTTDGASDHMRLSFATADVSEFPRAVSILHELLRSAPNGPLDRSVKRGRFAPAIN